MRPCRSSGRSSCCCSPRSQPSSKPLRRVERDRLRHVGRRAGGRADRLRWSCRRPSGLARRDGTGGPHDGPSRRQVGSCRRGPQSRLAGGVRGSVVGIPHSSRTVVPARGEAVAGERLDFRGRGRADRRPVDGRDAHGGGRSGGYGPGRGGRTSTTGAPSPGRQASTTPASTSKAAIRAELSRGMA